jgi:hypothetical protein
MRRWINSSPPIAEPVSDFAAGAGSSRILRYLILHNDLTTLSSR